MDMRSSLLGAAIMVASASLPSGAFAADDLQLYTGEYGNIFDGYGIQCNNPTAGYFYSIDPNTGDEVYESYFTYDFKTAYGIGKLIGNFNDNLPDGIWLLEYQDKIDGLDDLVTFKMTIPFSLGDPWDEGEIVLTTCGDDGRKTVDSGVYTLDGRGTTSLRTDNGRYLEKSPLSMDEVINVIRCINNPNTVTQIHIIGDDELYGSETYPNPMAQVTDIKIIDDELLDYETAEPIAIVDESEVKNEIVPMEDIYAGDDHKFDAVREEVVVRDDSVIKPTEPEVIFMAVEQPAEFPGGQAAMMRWIGENLRYPETAKENGISGRVIVKLVIEKDGTVSNPTIVKGVDPDLDREALRLVRSMPAWTPGRMNGRLVRSYFMLPVRFSLPE